jgi:hypothetical protein
MKPYEIYNLIWKTKYRKNGFDLDWEVLRFDDEKKIRLLFQPSMSVKDWLVNLLGFFPVPKIVRFRIMFFCFGWKSVYDACSTLILEEVIREYNEHPDYEIEICGHSYGGAMSIIAGIDLFKKTAVKANIVTFGAPRTLFFVISKLFSRKCFNKVEQYVFRSDLVPYCPPFLFYHHCKVVKLGKFKIKDFFNPLYSHFAYGDKTIYDSFEENTVSAAESLI